jgi:hypothetical protein
VKVGKIDKITDPKGIEEVRKEASMELQFMG